MPKVLLNLAVATLLLSACSSGAGPDEASTRTVTDLRTSTASPLPPPTRPGSPATSPPASAVPGVTVAPANGGPSTSSAYVVNKGSHDIDCVAGILGRRVTEDIIDHGREVTSQQMAEIQHCKLFLDGSDGEEKGQKPADRSDGEQQRQKLPDGQRLPSDWGPQELPNCRGSDQDGSGMAIGPQCNMIPPPPPAGVTLGTLLNVRLPSAQYGAPLDECQELESGQCSELHWEPVSNIRAGEFTQIRISPTNPDVMYAGVDSNDMTMYRSEDAGATWQLVHVIGHAAGLAISPVNSNIVLYTNLEAPVQRTNDGGTTWNSVVGNDPGSGHYNNPFTAIAFSEDQPNIVYTAALRGSERGGIWPAEPSDIFKSTDAGLTWERVGVCETCSSVQTILVKKGDSNVVWVAADGGLQYTEDGGQTWSGNVIPYLQKVSLETTNNAMDSMPKVIGLAIHPDRPEIMLAASSEYGMFRSTDGGSSWEHSNSGLETSKLHQVHFAPNDPNVAYLTTHHGIYRSDDGGESWNDRSEGLSYKYLSPIAIHPKNADVVFVGTTNEIYTIHPEHKNKGLYSEEGLYKSVDGGRKWFRSDRGIDEAKLAQMGAHPLLPFNIWAGGESGRGNFFSPDAGDSWLFSPSITGHYPMVYAFSYELPSVIYTTGWLRTGELTASTDGGASWYTLTHKLDQGLSSRTRELGLRTEGGSDFHLHGLAVAPSDPDIIYVGSVHDSVYPDLTFNLDGAHIFKSSDGGETFLEMSNGFPIETKTSINAIVIHPNDPAVAYAMTTLHETETSIGIYKTTNGAESWFSVNQGLDVLTNDLQIDPLNPNVLYAATESGVYKTTDAAETWTKSSSGLLEDPVIDMAIDPLNPLVLYAITPEDIYRSRDGAEHWYSTNLGLPLLEPSSAVLSAQDRLAQQLRLDRTNTGHSMYGGTFAQDRTLEIDATGRVIVVAVKTNRDDNEKRDERLLYRAVLTPLANVDYEFMINESIVTATSQSNIYDMAFDSDGKELEFIAAGPIDTTSRTTVLIPRTLLSGELAVFVDGERVQSSNTIDTVSFEHVHVGQSKVVIKGQ